jgi:hypothetical protein
MKLFFLIMLFLFSSCGMEGGKDGRAGVAGGACTVEDHEEGAIVKCDDGSEEILYDGEAGTDGIDGEDYTEPVSLEGFYELPFGGYIELVQLEDQRIMVYGTQRVYTKNFDQGLAFHPNITTAPYMPKEGKLIIEQNINYNTSTNDVEKDGTTSNISGKRKSIFTFSTQESQLILNIKIFSSNGLLVEVNRTIRSLE